MSNTNLYKYLLKAFFRSLSTPCQIQTLLPPRRAALKRISRKVKQIFRESEKEGMSFFFTNFTFICLFIMHSPVRPSVHPSEMTVSLLSAYRSSKPFCLCLYFFFHLDQNLIISWLALYELDPNWWNYRDFVIEWNTRCDKMKVVQHQHVPKTWVCGPCCRCDWTILGYERACKWDCQWGKRSLI